MFTEEPYLVKILVFKSNRVGRTSEKNDTVFKGIVLMALYNP